MNLTLLLHMSRRYELDESRADVYPMVNYWIGKNESNLEKIRGIATLLYVWNVGYYSRAGKSFAVAVSNVEEVFNKPRFHNLLSSIKNLELFNIDLKKHSKEITALYQCVHDVTGIGDTGTSKLLHLMQPQLFVMWDEGICNHYHKEHRLRNMWHKQGYDECYLEFLKDMQKEAKDLLTQSSKNQIKQGLFEISGYKKTIAKGLDEFNYMMFTVPQKKHNMKISKYL